MEAIINSGLKKVLTISQKAQDTGLEGHVAFLLMPTKDKINFLQNKKNYTGIDNAFKIADLLMFEDNEDVKILIGEKMPEIDNLCKEYIDSTNHRRQLQIALVECSNLYNKSLNISYDKTNNYNNKRDV